MMRALLTGHTSGFGRYLFGAGHQLTSVHMIEGVSRITDHDIATIQGRNKIVDMSIGFDVFINNAWSADCPNAQCALFQEVWHCWVEQGKEGSIVNIGSRGGVDGDIKNPYHLAKKRLLYVSDDYAKRRYPGITVSCINFGYFETPQNSEHRYLIEYSRAAMLVNMAINFGPTTQIRNMTVEAVPYGNLSA